MTFNFSALPTNAAASFTRFEPGHLLGSFSAGTLMATVVPVRFVKEWVYPRDAKNDNAPEFKTVRISEHKWPLHKTTTTCHAEYVRPDMWPAPKREPLTREGLILAGLLAPWNAFPRADKPSLRIDEKAWIEFEHSLANPTPNDGLPADYLEFWQEGKGDDNVAND